MQFFEITNPEYETDHEYAFRNPVWTSAKYALPGINCEVCGTWSSCDRLRVTLPPEAHEFEEVRFVSVTEWMQARHEWARLLGVNVDDLAPGADFGPPMGTCRSAITEDVVHPIPGEIWVRRSVRTVLERAHLVGVSFADVQLTGECDHVELAEIVVHGRAWRKGSTPENIRLCDICGRTGFPSPKYLAVDETRWDGSDFVILDGNPNIVVVTERVADVINTHAFSNLVVEPIA